MARLLNESRSESAPAASVRSAEGRFASAIREELEAYSSRTGSPMPTMSTNEFLEGCFEADIVIRLSSPESGTGAAASPRVINIEIDGPSHHFIQKMRLTKLRDAYLAQKCGVEVCRIPLKVDGFFNAAEIRDIAGDKLVGMQLIE